MSCFPEPWYINPIRGKYAGFINLKCSPGFRGVVGWGAYTGGLLLVGTGLRSLFMALLVFGILVYNVFWGGLAFDLVRLLDACLLVIVLPSFAAFAGILLRKRWGLVLAVASYLLTCSGGGGSQTTRYGSMVA
jgi:hypothetical protein